MIILTVWVIVGIIMAVFAPVMDQPLWGHIGFYFFCLIVGPPVLLSYTLFRIFTNE